MRDLMTIVEGIVPEATIFFHVTFKSRLPAIMRDGLLTGKKRNWDNNFGAKQGSTKHTYLFDNFTSAVRWAHKMNYHFEKEVVILMIANPEGTIEPDKHIEAQMNGGGWYTTDTWIPAQQIVRVIEPTQEMYRTLVRDGKIELPAT